MSSMTMSSVMVVLLLAVLAPWAVRAEPACQCQDWTGSTASSVCGSDGATYPSRCHLECAAAALARGAGPTLSLAHEGGCQPRTAAARNWADDLGRCLQSCTTTLADCTVKCTSDTDCAARCAKTYIGCACDCSKKYTPASVSVSDKTAVGLSATGMQSGIQSTALARSQQRGALEDVVACVQKASTDTVQCQMKCGTGDTACLKKCATDGTDQLCRCSASTTRQAALVLLLVAAARWLLPAL